MIDELYPRGLRSLSVVAAKHPAHFAKCRQCVGASLVAMKGLLDLGPRILGGAEPRPCWGLLQECRHHGLLCADSSLCLRLRLATCWPLGPHAPTLPDASRSLLLPGELPGLVAPVVGDSSISRTREMTRPHGAPPHANQKGHQMVAALTEPHASSIAPHPSANVVGIIHPPAASSPAMQQLNTTAYPALADTDPPPSSSSSSSSANKRPRHRASIACASCRDRRIRVWASLLPD